MPVVAGVGTTDRVQFATRDVVWISVSDSGVGIKAEDIPKLFQKFTQVDTSASRAGQGPGLGLALCTRFVELHGGQIGVESIFGKESTFWFLLPVDGPPPKVGAGGLEGRSMPRPSVIPRHAVRPSSAIDRCFILIGDTMHARGTFDVKLAPRTEGSTADGAIGQMSLDKSFHGDLSVTSEGEMLAGPRGTFVSSVPVPTSCWGSRGP